MKKKIAVLIVAAFLVSMLSGCSMFSLYDLTEDEANTIAAYSAHIVSKYNQLMSEGLVYPSDIDEEETESDIVSDDVTADASEENTQETGQSETEAEDTSTDETQTDGEDSETDTSAGADAAEKEQTETYVSFTDAVGVDGIEVKYVDYDVSDSVMESTFFSLNAAAGKTYVILNLKVKNTNSETTRVDILGSSPRFRININDETRVLSQTTLLLSDFSTMSENLQAGKAREKKLIFEVDSDAASDIDSIVLDVTINDNTSKTKLL